MIKQNPFSLYDFLGYFIPGALIIYLLIFVSSIDASNISLDLNELILNENSIKFQNLLFFIIVSYAVGHLVNFLSSILIEKFANWIYDYPSKYLLKIQKKFNFKTITIKRILIWLSIFPVSIFDLIFGQLFKFKNLYTCHLDDFLIHCIKQKGVKLINRHFKPAENYENSTKIGDYDFFRIFHHYTFEHTKSH